MNKEKLTLLIALSIFLIIVMTITCSTGATQSIPVETLTTNQTMVTTTLPPTTTTTTEELKVVTTTTKSAEPVPVAQQIWNAMKSKGWSDNVCAGILGNIMAECGGGTLDIQPYAHGDGKTSYGICQWHNERKSDMLSFNNQNYNTTNNLPTIEHQVDYIEYELDLYNIDILNTNKTYEEIAYIFCVQFEIPNNKYKKAEQRKQYAKIAYQNFAI